MNNNNFSFNFQLAQFSCFNVYVFFFQTILNAGWSWRQFLIENQYKSNDFVYKFWKYKHISIVYISSKIIIWGLEITSTLNYPDRRWMVEVKGGGSQDAVVIIRPQRQGAEGVTVDHHRAQCNISEHTVLYLKTLKKYSGLLFTYLRTPSFFHL